jgi:hypothetical protein
MNDIYHEISRALLGQIATHNPQPLQRSVSTSIFLDSVNFNTFGSGQE